MTFSDKGAPRAAYNKSFGCEGAFILHPPSRQSSLSAPEPARPSHRLMPWVQWKTLEVYLADGRVEIDNNLVENAIRPTALGKKNWLFVGDAGAGDRGAILYTIVECCRRRGFDPYTYLRDILTRLPRMTNHQIPEVTPAAWAQAQTPLQRQAAS